MIDKVIDVWVDHINNLTVDWLVENNIMYNNYGGRPRMVKVSKLDEIFFDVNGFTFEIPNKLNVDGNETSLPIIMYGRLREALITRLDNPAFMEYIRLKTL